MKPFQPFYPSRTVRMILHIELPMTLLYAVTFLISYLRLAESDPITATLSYRPLLVTLLYPALITAFSILLVARLEETGEKDE